MFNVTNLYNISRILYLHIIIYYYFIDRKIFFLNIPKLFNILLKPKKH